jgi:hypothetical protein
MGGEGLCLAQFDQRIIPSLFSHIGDAQVDVGCPRTRIESNDGSKILFGHCQLTVLHGLHTLAEDRGRLQRGVLRGQAKNQRQAQESFS